MSLTSCHVDTLLHNYWLVRLAEKGSVLTACEASCVSLTLFTVTAEISLLAYFLCCPFSDAHSHQYHFDGLCAQCISLATCAGVRNIVQQESSWFHLFEKNQEEQWTEIEPKERQRVIFAMTPKEKMKWCILCEKKCKWQALDSPMVTGSEADSCFMSNQEVANVAQSVCLYIGGKAMPASEIASCSLALTIFS